MVQPNQQWLLALAEPPSHRQGSRQSTGCAPRSASSAFVRLNGREPKNPRCADSGDGCTDSMVATRESPAASMGFSVDASRPHRMATSGAGRAASARIAHSVTTSQPLPRWDAGFPGCTVNPLLSSKTPCCAHGVRSPLDGVGYPRSAQYSPKMFSRLRGNGLTSRATEKLSPTGWPGVG